MQCFKEIQVKYKLVSIRISHNPPSISRIFWYRIMLSMKEVTLYLLSLTALDTAQWPILNTISYGYSAPLSALLLTEQVS